MLEYTVLFSGSSGNCTYLKTKDRVLLIDAGVSGKKIREALADHQIDFSMVAGILLTHEHTDHVIGLKQLVDRFNIPLYTNKKTYYAIRDKYRPQKQENVNFLVDEMVDFPDFDVQVHAYPISHDVKDGRFYVVKNSRWKFVYLTDSGYVSEKLYENIANANAYVIEANHEPELVLQSGYPWHIQQRILSDKGHLSNQDCSLLLEQIVGDQTEHIVLAHLSEENNNPEIAYNRINACLQRLEKPDIILQIAERDNLGRESLVIK